jgi:hypothetical protein
MKNLVLIFSLFLTSTCFADMVVIYNKDNKEIYTVSSKDDTIVPTGYEKKVLSGDLTDFTEDTPNNYKFVNNKFVKNIAKISVQEQAKIDEQLKQAEEKLIADESRALAIKSLKDKGVAIKADK